MVIKVFGVHPLELDVLNHVNYLTTVMHIKSHSNGSNHYN